MPTGLENLDLKVYLDYAQERQNRKGPYVFATDGTQLDAGSKKNCIIDPVTLSVFGTPLPMTNTWKSGFGASDPSSNYYRFQKGDFTFTSAGGATDWKVNNYFANGDCYIFSGSSVTSRQNAPIRLTNGVKRNEALFFSYSKMEKKNTDTAPLIKLFWANDTNKDKDTQLHLNSDGSCDVFRGYISLLGTIQTSGGGTAVTGTSTKFQTQTNSGNEIYDGYGRLIGTIGSISNDTSLTLSSGAGHTYQGSYFRTSVAFDNNGFQYSGPKKVQSYSRTESNYNQSRPISTIANPNDQFNDVYLIPMRGKELLVLTSYGLNFSHSFSDLNTPNPPINVNYYFNGVGTGISVENTNISSTPIILPEGNFSTVISQGKIAFQLAKLNFLSNWTIDSQVINTASAPPGIYGNYTGTISASQGSTVITGTGTLFSSEVNLGSRISSIDYLTLEHNVIGTVIDINSDTEIYLTNESNYKLTNSDFYTDTPLSGLFSYGIGSTIVTGSGTSFSSEINNNDLLYDNNDNLVGQVSSIVSNSLLYLSSYSSIGGSNQTPIYRNVNVYKNLNINFQTETFGQVYPDTNNQELRLTGQILASTGATIAFDNVNKSFKIRYVHSNLASTASTTSNDYGIAAYSFDQIYTLENEKTSNSAVDITSAIESLSISRSENGDLSLSLDARHKLLLDLGVVKPDILSNRSIKVNLEPRTFQLNGTISTGSGTTLVTGVGTSFLTDFSPGDSVYKTNGTLVGIAVSIPNNTNLYTLEEYPGGIEYNFNYSNQPNYEPISIFEGYLDSPDINYIQGLNYENYALLSFNAIDKKQRLNAAYLDVAPNFDNVVLPTSIERAIYLGGQFNNSNNTSSFSTDPSLFFPIPINRNNSQGQYNFVLNLGDTSGGYIEKVRSDYAQNFTFYAGGFWNRNLLSENGWNFATRFQMQDLDYVPISAPPIILYLNEESAFDFGGIPTYESDKRTIRNLKRTYETPEANRIIITGLDKTDGSRITYQKDDVNSQDAMLPPNSRADNWLGDVYPFVMINDKFNTFQDAKQAGDQFYAKLTPGRELIEFETDLLTFFNSQTKFTSTIVVLSGTITTSSSSTTVSGFSTLFTTEISIGDTLYDNLGNILGIVKVINSDISLDLINNALIGYPVDVTFNKSTYYLNQYNYLDIGDIFYLADLEDNLTSYMIIDFSVDFIREYINPEYTTVIPRSAKYRAKKVEIPADNAPFFYSDDKVFPLINNWIVSSGYTMSFQVFAIALEAYRTITYSLANAPVGMTITTVDRNGQIEWTPSVGDENQIYENIEVIAFDGTSSSSFFFNVRVYPTI
jgi:hypothetical protein